MSEALPDILIDSQEPKSLYEEVAKLCAGKYTVVQEPGITDIVIPGKPGWAIERKEASDFVNTWLSEDKRLGDQLENLKELERMSGGDYRAALMLVGNPTVAKGKNRHLNVNAVQSVIDSITVKWGIFVMPIYQEWRVPYTIRYITGAVHGEKSNYAIRSAAKKEWPPAKQAVYVLQGFPGIGPATTEKIRQSTQTLGSFVYGLVEQTTDGGLTEKQADKVKEVLFAEWRKKQDEPGNKA